MPGERMIHGLSSKNEVMGRFLLVLSALLLCVLGSEALIRVAIPLGAIHYPDPSQKNTIHRYSGSYDLVYEMKPNSEGFDGVAVVKTNSLGMKDLEYPIKKEDGVFRVVFIGDSVTFGPGLAREQLYTEILEQKLNSAGRRIEILNGAVVGYNSAQEDVYLREKALKLNPDMIVVGYCLNDLTPTDGFEEIARQMHPKSLGSRLNSKFISFALDRLETATLSWFESDRATERLFANLARAQKELGIKTAVIIFPYNFTDSASYKKRLRHQKVHEIAEAEGLRILDFLEVTDKLSAEQRSALYQKGDKLHFADMGMKRIADWLYDQNPLLPPTK